MSSEQSSSRSAPGPLILIALVLGVAAALFAYTAGWFSPERLTPNKFVDAFAPPGGPALGHRRNHAKGICFTGVFAANGAGSELSTAPMLRAGEYAVVGRLNLASPDFMVKDATARVRGMGLQISEPGGQVWRMAMIDAPFFPVATPDALFGLLKASAAKDSNAMKDFAAAHPELGHFGAWAQSAPWTASYAEEPYNSLNSFLFTNAAGMSRTVRWSLRPIATPTVVPSEELSQREKDFLEEEIARRVAAAPVQWKMVVIVANAGDPTADPSQAWPEGRATVDVGTLTATRIEAEPNGPCRDINYDPTVLPSGISTSDDPFPAARSSAYRRSFDLRTAEADHYPHSNSESAP